MKNPMVETAAEAAYPLEITSPLAPSPPADHPPETHQREPESGYNSPEFDWKRSRWQRLTIGATCFALGLGAISVGVASFTYRLTHLSVDNGIVNGRTVRLRTPTDGKIQDFYARPGAPVRMGQALAQLSPLFQGGADLAQLHKKVQLKIAELTVAQQSLDLLNHQRQQLESQNQQLQTVNVAIAAEDVNRYQADIDAALAIERAARSDYERHQPLLAAGAVSKQQVDHLRAVWEAAKAEVQQKRAQSTSAQVSLQALSQGAPIGDEADLQAQYRTLMRKAQDQMALISTLEIQVESLQAQIDQTRGLYGDLEKLQISAPFSGVIYSTEYDAGEQVNRLATLLSLLDCNDLWVDALVTADQANRINIHKPVRVRVSGQSETLVGTVETIRAISTAALSKLRTQALIPTVSAKLAKHPLAMVKVRIPPTDQQMQAHQFCGVGQSAQLTFGLRLFDAPR